jgi:hypothetical protein
MLLTTPYSKLATKYMCAVGLFICFAQCAWARPPSRTPVDVNIVAHQDDDILFMNPDILNAVVAGHRQVTVFITSGSVNQTCYALDREAGAIAGYQKLLQLADTIRAHPHYFDNFTETFQGDSRHPAGCSPSPSPTCNTFFACDPHAAELKDEGTPIIPAGSPSPIHIGSRDLPVVDIGDAPGGGPWVRLIFLRLQTACYLDGNFDPDFLCGNPVNLGQLFQSGDLQIKSIFNDPTDPNYVPTPPYTKQQLINQLVDILNFAQPNTVRTQDPADGHKIDYELSSTTTTIAPPSDGQQIPGPTAPAIDISVASTAGFPSTGLVDIDVVGDRHYAVAYTGTTSTMLTGCHGEDSLLPGVMNTGNVVTFACEQVLEQGCNHCAIGGSHFYDHSDHVWGARFARQAVVRYDNLPNSQNQPTYFTYKGYNLEWNEARGTRLGTKDFCLKKGIFFNYAVYDNDHTCIGGGAALCDTPYAEPDPNNNFDCFSYLNIGYQKGQQQQSP